MQYTAKKAYFDWINNSRYRLAKLKAMVYYTYNSWGQFRGLLSAFYLSWQGSIRQNMVDKDLESRIFLKIEHHLLLL
jgi:hypothetical protein